MSLPTLTGMVVGGMVGAGVFSLPARFGVATGILGSLIAWAVAGAGMLMLAFVFQNLAVRKPDLDSGVFIYAKAGFGDYVGFNSAIGFWASAVAGNTFYWVFISATLGGFFVNIVRLHGEAAFAPSGRQRRPPAGSPPAWWRGRSPPRQTGIPGRTAAVRLRSPRDRHRATGSA